MPNSNLREIIRRFYWFIFGADRALYLHAQCLDAFLEIERGLRSGRLHFRESEQNYDFLNLIGKAAASLDRFSTFLYNRLSSSEELKDIANYIKANNNQILSCIKHSFFKETPNKPKSFEITSEALRLIDGKLIAKRLYKLSIDELKSSVAYFYYHAFLTFSFIYSKATKSGTFLKFKYDKEQFEKVRGYINEQLKGIRFEEQFRLFADKLPSYIIKTSADLQDDNIVQLFDRAVKADFNVEPLTWRLGVNIWLIGQTLQDRDEIVDSNDYNDTTVETIKENIFKYLNETYTFYESSTMDFRRLYEAESGLITLKILKPKTKEEFSNYNEALKKLVTTTTIENNSIETTPAEFICPDDEEGFKLKNLLQALEIAHFDSLIAHYCCKIDQSGFAKDSHLIGLYKSGGLLAHFYNMIYHEGSKKVWLYKAYPIVATYPLHDNSSHSKDTYKKAILFDECIKTGYTYLLYKHYYNRCHNTDIEANLMALFDFVAYKKIPQPSELKYESIFQIKPSDFGNRQLSLGKNKFMDMRGCTFKTLKGEILSPFVAEFHSNMIDLTFLLTDSRILWAIANLFKDEVIKLAEENKAEEVTLFSPSIEGEMLMLAVAYLLKKDGKQINLDVNESKGSVFAIDLSFDTGYTLWSSYHKATNLFALSSHFNHEFETNSIKCILLPMAKRYDKRLTFVKISKDGRLYWS